MNVIEESGEKFKILDRIPIGICLLREDFVLIYWNRCLEKWAGSESKVTEDRMAPGTRLRYRKGYSGRELDSQRG